MRFSGLFACSLASAIVLGCAASSKAPPVPPLGPQDAGASAPDAGDASAPPPIADVPCNDDAPCNDGFPCTDDRCDLTAGRCVHVAYDERCEDGVYCNGSERCDLRRGCVTGGDVCGLGNACTIARCDETARACTTTPRDADGDGDPDDHCGGGDCNDADARRSSRMAEVCANGIDDNCNGAIDEQPCLNAEGDRCEAPVVLASEGFRTLSTAGATAAPPSGCAFPVSGTSKTIFARVERHPTQDLMLEVVDLASPVTLALLDACGGGAAACEQAAQVPFPRVRIGAGPAGSGQLVAIATPTDATLRVRTSLLPSDSTRGTNDCSAPEPLALGVAKRVDFASLAASLPSDCSATGLRTFLVDVPRDGSLVVDALSLTGRGSASVGLRYEACRDLADEIACRNLEAGPLVIPFVAAGRYVVTVAPTTAPSVELRATLGPAGTFAAGDSCFTPLVVAPGTRVTASFDQRADFVRSGCLAGGSTLAFRVDLPSPADVMLVGRVPDIALGGLAVHDAACTPGAPRSCNLGNTPLHVVRRAEPAGPLLVSVSSNGGGSGSLAVYTRSPAADVPVSGGSTCAGAIAIPAAGGRFSGDSSAEPSSVGASCDTGLANPRAPTQLFRLDLPARRRVAISTSGSAFTTIASLRSGAACPGLEVPEACNVGFTSARSFLDRVLEAGTHWVVLTGFGGAKGAWNLDVFTTAP